MRVNVFCSNIGTSFSKSLTQMVQGPQPNLKTIHSKLVTEYNQRNINNYGWGVICSRGYIYLRLVNTNGVPLRKLRPLVSDCSFPSLVGSSVLLEPEKGQNPLDLDSFLMICIYYRRISDIWAYLFSKQRKEL